MTKRGKQMANKKQNDTTNNDAGFANETMQKQTVEQDRIIIVQP